MSNTRLADGQIAKIYSGDKKCPRTVLITFSGAIVNFADVYISPDINSLKQGDSDTNNANNPFFKKGIGLFNQGLGAIETLNPYQILNVTSDIFALYDAKEGKAFIDISVEAF